MKKRMTWVALVMALVMVVAQGAWASEVVEPGKCGTCECTSSVCMNGCGCKPGTWCDPACKFANTTAAPETSTGTTFVATETGNAPSVYEVTEDTVVYKDPENKSVGTMTLEKWTQVTVTQRMNIGGISYGYVTIDNVGWYVKMEDLQSIVLRTADIKTPDIKTRNATVRTDDIGMVSQNGEQYLQDRQLNLNGQTSPATGQ